MPAGAGGPEGEKGDSGPAGPPTQPSTQGQAAATASPPEVLIIAGDDTITIASEDQDALR